MKLSSLSFDIDTLTHCSLWIEPNGKYHAVEECGHERWARENHETDSYALEVRGWIHLSYGNIRHQKKATQAQIDFLFDFTCIVETHSSNYGAKNNSQRRLIARFQELISQDEEMY